MFIKFVINIFIVKLKKKEYTYCIKISNILVWKKYILYTNCELLFFRGILQLFQESIW